MTQQAQILIEQACRLSAEERLEIADALMATLDEPDPALDQAWLAEAKDRLEAYRRGDMAARDLDEILAGHRKP